jgi:hypothetical protein
VKIIAGKCSKRVTLQNKVMMRQGKKERRCQLLSIETKCCLECQSSEGLKLKLQGKVQAGKDGWKEGRNIVGESR